MSGLFFMSTDVQRNVNLFQRDNDPVIYECAAYRCPVIDVKDARGHSRYWATEDDVRKHCSIHKKEW